MNPLIDGNLIEKLLVSNYPLTDNQGFAVYKQKAFGIYNSLYDKNRFKIPTDNGLVIVGIITKPHTECLLTSNDAQVSTFDVGRSGIYYGLNHEHQILPTGLIKYSNLYIIANANELELICMKDMLREEDRTAAYVFHGDHYVSSATKDDYIVRGAGLDANCNLDGNRFSGTKLISLYCK